MKLKHTQKKSANRGMAKEIFQKALIGITGQHGQRVMPLKNTQFAKSKRRNRQREDKHLKNVK